MSRVCLIGVSVLLLIFVIVSIIVYASVKYIERSTKNIEENLTVELNKTGIADGVEILHEGFSLLYALYRLLYLIFILILAYFIVEVMLYSSACR